MTYTVAVLIVVKYFVVDESSSPSKKYDASSSLDLDASLKLDYARGEAQLDSSSDDSAFEYDGI